MRKQRFLDRFGANSATGAQGDVCVEPAIRELRQNTLTLEQKVAHLYGQWHDPVFRYLVAVFGQQQQADEITQDVFLELFRALHAGHAINNARAWVFRVAHNLAVDQLKGRQFIEPIDDGAWEDLRRTLRDEQPGPEQRLLQQEKFDRLRVGIARLTLAERQCLHLRTKGLRYREISEILGLSTTAVAETLYRVIEKLAKEQ